MNSQASGQGQGQGPPPSATLRKPMPVRYSMPPSSDFRAANGECRPSVSRRMVQTLSPYLGILGKHQEGAILCMHALPQEEA